MNAESYAPYWPVEMQTRHTFVGIINAACHELDVSCTWSSDDWLAQLTHNGRTRHIYGYTFPVNNASASEIMSDKAATYAILQQAGIAALPHYLLRLRTEAGARSTADYALTLVPLPVVIKPNQGKTSGNDVVKCDTYEHLVAAITDLATRHKVLAVSPLAGIKHEYRVVVLNNTPKVVFEKLRQAGTWHHNLTKGAQPQLVTDDILRTKLEQFALKAVHALDANLAAVDIVETASGLQILEVNAGIMLNTFSGHNQQNAQIAHTIYKDIIGASLA